MNFETVFEELEPDGTAWLDERPEDRPCEDCGVMLEPSKDFRADRWLVPPPTCYECERKDERESLDKERRRKSYQDSLDAAELPKRPLKEARRLGLNKPIPEVMKFCKVDPKEGDSIFLHGPTGTGKTLQSVLAIKAFLYLWSYQSGRRVSARYAHLGDVIDKTKRSFGDGEPVDWDALENCDLLVIDDMSTERGTEYAAEVIGNLIDYRYREMKATIFIANVSPFDLAGKTGAYDDRVAGRIVEMCGGSTTNHIRLAKKYRTGSQGVL